MFDTVMNVNILVNLITTAAKSIIFTKSSRSIIKELNKTWAYHRDGHVDRDGTGGWDAPKLLRKADRAAGKTFATIPGAQETKNGMLSFN